MKPTVYPGCDSFILWCIFCLKTLIGDEGPPLSPVTAEMNGDGSKTLCGRINSGWSRVTSCPPPHSHIYSHGVYSQANSALQTENEQKVCDHGPHQGGRKISLQQHCGWKVSIKAHLITQSCALKQRKCIQSRTGGSGTVRCTQMHIEVKLSND